MIKKKVDRGKYIELIQHVDGNKLLINRVIHGTCMAYEDDDVRAMEIKEFDTHEELISYFNSQK